MRQRYGKIYREHREWLNDFDTWSQDRAEAYQNEQLRSFVKYAVQHSEFYRGFYSTVDVEMIKSVSDLRLLPVLEKETLRGLMEQIYTVSASKSTEGHTGGTTGKSLVVRYTHSDEMRRMAMLDHFKSRFGFENLKMRKATFSGKHLTGGSKSSRVFGGIMLLPSKCCIRLSIFQNQILSTT